MRRIFLATAGLTTFQLLHTWRQYNTAKKCDGVEKLFEKTPVDAKTVLRSMNTENEHQLRKYWVEPKCGVPFPELLETATVAGKNEVLSFLGGGLRCMLGDSSLCDLQPHTRVYAYGLYVPPTESPTGESFRNAILKMKKYSGTRTIRLVVIIPKDGIHWARGFFKSISQHAMAREYDYNKKRAKLAHKAIIKFCEMFAELGNIPAGTEFHFTWSKKGLILLMDGTKLGTIQNVDAIGSIFKVFFNVTDNSLQKPVNENVAVQAQRMWNLREKSPGVFYPQPVVECPIFDATKQPETDPCFLMGNQFTLLSSSGFDVARSKWKRKPCDESKKIRDTTNSLIGEWESFEDSKGSDKD